MCGFIGITSETLYIKDQIIENAEAILCHRGPDNAMNWRDDNVVFIHNRLSIIDLTEQANQPFVDPDTGNCIIFNGETYNFKKLKKEFSGLGWSTNSDTEVIIKLFSRIGRAFVEKLTGIFAFAIYDKSRHKIFLYRDRFGVKPLYFHLSADSFIFASEVKGISFFKPTGHSNEAIAAYLEYGSLANDSNTFFENVFSLPPAHFLEYDMAAHRISIHRYWDIGYGESCFGDNEQEVFAKVKELLKRSIRLNLVSDVEIGVSLSSGTDSTFLLKSIQKESNTRFKAFTFGFDDPAYDEVIRVQKNEHLRDIELQPVYLKKESMLEVLKEAIYFSETPVGDLGALSAYHMMKAVRNAGIKVMLAGEGSDEVFCGYKYYYPAFFIDIEHELQLLKKELKCYSEYHDTPTELFSTEYDQLISLVKRRNVLAPDGTSAAKTHIHDEFHRFIRTRPQRKMRIFCSKLKEIMYRDLTEKKLPKLLHFQDRASSASGIETRVPYLDQNLIDYIYGLPVTYKIRNGQNKYILRQLLKNEFGFIENSRIKHYVATPQREWIKDTRTRDQILESVRYGKLTENKVIDFDRFQKDYIEYSNSDELGNSFFVWKIIELEYLLNQDFSRLQ